MIHTLPTRDAIDTAGEAPGGTLTRLDERLSTLRLLLGFWLGFWLLNGLDKVFNGPMFFGVTRDAKFVDYFARIGLGAPVALASLYTCAVVELILSALFAAALWTGSALLARLALKGSLLVFFTFSMADVLFGDRAELWEHATFLVLVLTSLGFVGAPREAVREVRRADARRSAAPDARRSS